MKFKYYFDEQIIQENTDTSDINDLYDKFKNNHEEISGIMWDKKDSTDIQYFGDEHGYIAIQPQPSGLYKLIGAAGSHRSKIKGMEEIINQKLPVWGLVSKQIKNILLKIGFQEPDYREFKILYPHAQSIINNGTIKDITNDKGLKINYGGIGTVIKYFVGTSDYWKNISK